jgi:hypothetical protein
MNPVEWYYARGNKQMGPVPAADLKRLASVGELRPEDLVWREGMTEWTLARNVRGLFDGEEKAAIVTTEVIVSRGTGSPSAIGQAAAATPSVAVPPAPYAVPSPRRHPLDALLDGLRTHFDAPFIDRTSKVFRQCGSYGLLAAMLLVVVFAVIMTAKTHNMESIPAGVAVVLVLAVLQYAAGKFCDVLEQLNRTTSSNLSSAAFPNLFALLSLAMGLASLIGLTITAIELARHSAILLGVASLIFGLVGFVVCGYLAIIAVNLPALNISIVPETRAGEEAIGVSAFLLKALLRLVPVWFGASVVCVTVGMGYACWQAMSATAGMGGIPFVAFEIIGGTPLYTILVAFAALPVTAYLLFVFYCLGIDVLRAFLVLPGKIDRLAAKDDEKKIGQ